MITLYESKDKCCGCSACQSICPTNAIQMISDGDGFLYPHVQKDKCIECEMCIKTCVFKSTRSNEKTPINAYAAINKDKEVLINSSSGGVFGAVATKVLEKNGVVFGCSMNGKYEANHVYITNLNQLKALQGSKYIQSNIGESYKKVKEYLNSDKKVLFSGTPCQVDGLKSYLKIDYDNLITTDIICHGVPSPKFFKDYMNYLERKENLRILKFNFRDTDINYMSCAGKITYIKGKKVCQRKMTYHLDCFYNYFMYGVIFRECCYKCPYTNGNRPGDLTMGDYWGVQNYHPEIKTDKGVSALLVNTQKGVDLVSELNLDIINTNFNNILNHNSNLVHPTPMNKDRDSVFKLYRESGIEAVVDNFYRKLGFKYYYYYIKNMIPISTKRRLKKILRRE